MTHRRNITEKFAFQAEEAFARTDLDPLTAAADVCYQNPPQIRANAFEFAYHIMRVLAISYDSGNMGSTPEETRALINSKRVIDALDGYDPDED